MPTQEDINAANVELQIANDNFAQVADRMNKFTQLFNAYRTADPATQERAKGAMESALEEYKNLKAQQAINQDRIAVAQNTVNILNSQLAPTPNAANYGGQRRRTTTAQPSVIERNQPTTYQVPKYTHTQNAVNLQRGVMPTPPDYAPLPEYTPQYKSNTLGGIAGNIAGQVNRDWQQAGNEWRNIVWPNMKNTVKQGFNGVYNTFVKTPVKTATDVLNFTFGKPQQR